MVLESYMPSVLSCCRFANPKPPGETRHHEEEDPAEQEDDQAAEAQARADERSQGGPGRRRPGRLRRRDPDRRADLHRHPQVLLRLGLTYTSCNNRTTVIS